MDIKEIALRVAKKMRAECEWDVIDLVCNSEKFTEAIIAELAKQNEPVACRYKDHNGHWCFMDKQYGNNEPLYTFPPTAEQIANETAWQPIETAPKDGRELILLLTPSNWPQVAYSNTWWQGGFSVENKPTHWMPLPTPPKRSMEGV